MIKEMKKTFVRAFKITIFFKIKTFNKTMTHSMMTDRLGMTDRFIFPVSIFSLNLKF